MNLHGKITSKISIDMSGYIMIGFVLGGLIGILVGNLVLGAGIGMCYGILITVFANL